MFKMKLNLSLTKNRKVKKRSGKLKTARQSANVALPESPDPAVRL